MAGLLEKKRQQQEGGGRPQAGPRQQPGGGGGGGGMMRQPEAGGDQQQGMEEEETSVSPEEQAEYDEFVTNGMKLIYSENTMDQVLQTIESDGDPVQGLGNAVATVIMRLEDSAEKGGREISGDVKLNAATELLEQMADLAKEAGIHDFSEQELEAALYRGLDTYREARQEQGRLPKEELTEDFAELIEADREGRVDEVVPGLEEYARQRAPEGAGGGEQGGGGEPGGGERRPNARQRG